MAELDAPLFWTSDANGDKSLDPSELAVLWRPVPTNRLEWVDSKGSFTPKFEATYEAATKPLAFDGLDAAERKRRETVALELSQGRPTLHRERFLERAARPPTLVSRLLRVAALIERLHMRQKGTLGLDARNSRGRRAASRSLFFRNQGPFCARPEDRERSRLQCRCPRRPKPVFGLYPSELQADPKFCAKLESAKNAKELTGHFAVVTREGGNPARSRR